MEDPTANGNRDGRAVVVLCGGESRRMGRDKASLPFAETTMLARVVSVARQLASVVIVVKAAGQTLPELPSGVILVDDELPAEGPLRGIVTGLAASPPRVEEVMVLGCDMPLVEAAVLAPLFDQLEGFDAVIPQVEGRSQPLAAVYRTWVLPLLKESLESGNRKLLNGIQQLNVRWIDLPAVTLGNINTPADYARAQSQWAVITSTTNRAGASVMPHAEAWQQLQKQFTIADNLVLEFMADLEPELWFQMPGQGVTHIAWQVGHMTLSNYGLGLAYVRGAQREDAKLLPGAYQDLFGGGSQPSSDPAIYPTGEELAQTYRNVSQQIRQEMPTYDLDALDVPLEKPHPMFKTPLEALGFLPLHLSMHLGQMSLLRRLAGKPPRR